MSSPNSGSEFRTEELFAASAADCRWGALLYYKQSIIDESKNQNMDLFIKAKELGHVIVGVEPSIISFFRKDYGDPFFEHELDKTVLLIQELLANHEGAFSANGDIKESYYFNR